MNILALDLGTHTGFAYNVREKFFCGTWVLATPKEIRAWGKERVTRRNDPRISRLCNRLDSLIWFDALVFEDVQFSTYTLQTQLWSSLRSSVWICGKAGVNECVPVATLKKFATGHGGATKEMMSDHLKKKHLALWSPSLGDDAVDACWLWLWAKQNLARMK